MRKISRLGIALVVATMMLGLMATGAQAGKPNANKYEWCHGPGPERPCYGVVTVNTKPAKTWSDTAGEISGTWEKAKHSALYAFKFTNASDEACEVRMTKPKKSHNFTGAEYCEGHEIEPAEWRNL